MQTYSIRLSGPAVPDARVPVTIARDLLIAVEQGARGAVRLRLEGRSAAKGPPPGWLKKASEFDLVSMIEDRAGMRLEAPSLSDALPGRFSQVDLFAPVDPEKSALAFLSDSLRDAVTGEADSSGYDMALLKSFHSAFGNVLRSGVEVVELRNGRRDAPVVVLTKLGLRSIENLHNTTPTPRRVRLAGRLDTIRYSDRAFTLQLDSGKKVRGVLADGAAEMLAPYFGRLAIISGMAHYRPSGSLLRIDAERIAVGTEQDALIWGTVPESLDARLELRQVREPQGPRSGLAALIGSWPGDETDDEIFEALGDLS